MCGYRQAKVGDWCVSVCMRGGVLSVSVWIQTIRSRGLVCVYVCVCVGVLSVSVWIQTS